MDYIKYLNKSQQKKVEKYKYVNDKDFLIYINIGDSIKYIKKKNLNFIENVVVEKIINNDVIQLKNSRYQSSYLINKNDHIILHKSKIRTKNDILRYILKGMDNNTIKISKKIM